LSYTSKRPANLVQTIERVDNLLVHLSKEPQGLSLGKLAEQVGLPKGTTHRLVSSLSYFNYIKQDPSSRKYRLGFKLVKLGNMLLDQIDIRSESRPFLFELAQRSQETAHLVILDSDEALYIDKIQLSGEGLHMASRTGYRIPLHCTASGKVILAHLSPVEIERIIAERGLPRRTDHTITDAEQLKSLLHSIKHQGFALDNEEHTEGVRCVAAPIYNMNGDNVAAISISAPAVRVTLEKAQQSVKAMVMDTAKKISNQLGYSNKYTRGDR
jgi:DNA-binding IclR family transcriptional regulator